MDHPQGEFEPDAFKDNSKQQPGARVSEPVAAPEELKKIHVDVEIQKARAEEKMIPTHQKRMMFAKQHKLEREKTLERDAALRHRAELVGVHFSLSPATIILNKSSK